MNSNSMRPRPRSIAEEDEKLTSPLHVSTSNEQSPGILLSPPSPSVLHHDDEDISRTPSPATSQLSINSTQPLLKSGACPPPRAKVRCDTNASQSTYASCYNDDAVKLTPCESPTDNPDKEAAKAWSMCAREMMEYDTDNVKRWKDELDTLLVYAGLFSAVVTAFLVESCKSLHTEPAERIITVLELIAAQLSNATVESVESPEIDTRFVPENKAAFVNALWFTSLIFSLGVAFVGLLAKQWLGEYTSGLMTVSRSRVSKKHARARQHRHNALRKWKVVMIMTALPTTLQVALILFLIGLADLLLGFNYQVGVVALTFLTFMMAFSVFTSILPTFFEDCSYRSPQAYLIYTGSQWLLSSYRTLLRSIRWLLLLASPRTCLPSKFKESSTFESAHNERNMQLSLPSVLGWLNRHGGKRTHWSWKDREELALQSECPAKYEASMLDELDSVKMDIAILQAVIQPCLRTLPMKCALECVRKLLVRRADGVSADGFPDWHRPDLDPETHLILVDILLDLLQRTELGWGAEDTEVPSDHACEDLRVQGLWMLQGLVAAAGVAFACDDGRYDRLLEVLLVYRRRKDNNPEARRLVYRMLTTCVHAGLNIPPDVVRPADIDSVIEYSRGVGSKNDFSGDIRAPVSFSTLAVRMMSALLLSEAQHPVSASKMSAFLQNIMQYIDQTTNPSCSSSKLQTPPTSLNTPIRHFLIAVEGLLPLLGNQRLDYPLSWVSLKKSADDFFKHAAQASNTGSTTQRPLEDRKAVEGDTLCADAPVMMQPCLRAVVRTPLIREAGEMSPLNMPVRSSTMAEPQPPRSSNTWRRITSAPSSAGSSVLPQHVYR